MFSCFRFAPNSNRFRSLSGIQLGQALTEFLVVAATILVPLFLIIPLIAKLISQQQDVEVAARYAAWERTVWYDSARPPPRENNSAATNVVKSDFQVAREIDRRIFSLDTQQIVSDAGSDFELNPFSRTNKEDGGELKPLLDEQASSSGSGSKEYAVVNSNESEPTSIVGVVDDFMAFMGEATRFDLNRKGLFTANTRVDLIDLTDYFDLPSVTLDSLSLSRSNTIFAEAWEAGGTEHAEYLVSGLMPQQYLDNGAFKDFQDFASGFPFSRELDPDWLRFGYVTIEPVPDHRLGPVIGP